MIDKRCNWKAILGSWRDNGFSIKEEPDTIDGSDNLVCLYFKGQKIASYYKSKLPKGIEELDSFIQKQCQTYWDNTMIQFTRSI